MNITHPELVKALIKPGGDIVLTLTAQNADLWHMATGVAGEAGELLEFYDAYVKGQVSDNENLIEELGDIEFYLEGVRQNLGITRSEIVKPKEEMLPNSFGLNIAAVVIQSLMLLDLVKKQVIYNKAVDRALLIERLAIIDCYLGFVRTTDPFSLGVTREECLEHNIAKLSVRYAGLAYSDDAAQARADKAD